MNRGMFADRLIREHWPDSRKEEWKWSLTFCSIRTTWQVIQLIRQSVQYFACTPHVSTWKSTVLGLFIITIFCKVPSLSGAGAVHTRYWRHRSQTLCWLEETWVKVPGNSNSPCHHVQVLTLQIVWILQLFVDMKVRPQQDWFSIPGSGLGSELKLGLEMSS